MAMLAQEHLKLVLLAPVSRSEVWTVLVHVVCGVCGQLRAELMVCAGTGRGGGVAGTRGRARGGVTRRGKE